jgi:hypothetical protein
MEPEASLSRSQDFASGPYAEAYDSVHNLTHHIFEIYVNIILPYRLHHDLSIFPSLEILTKILYAVLIFLCSCGFTNCPTQLVFSI